MSMMGDVSPNDVYLRYTNANAKRFVSNTRLSDVPRMVNNKINMDAVILTCIELQRIKILSSKKKRACESHLHCASFTK